MDIRRFTQQICRDADVKDIRVIERKIGNHHNSANKRKRRSTLDEKEFDHEHEAKRRYITSCSQPPSISKATSTSSSSERSSPIPSPLGVELAIDTDSAVDTNSPGRLSTEFDGDYDSPGRQFDGVSSPSSCNSIANCTCSSWHTRGDVTPHAKQPCRRLRHSISPERDLQCCIKPTAETRPCPLPALSWANALDVWKVMCRKDEMAVLTRTASMLDNHPGLQPRMRAILLDWLIEVCEVYKLHRETYYLAVDYLDRYLSCNKKVQKTHLQLIGITCLFVAAKVEEIYPPKIGEFAYVTDGACQEEDILQQELLLLKALDWNISPVTILGWLGVYMQLNVNNRTPSSFVNRGAQKDLKSSQIKHVDACVDRNPKCKTSVIGVSKEFSGSTCSDIKNKNISKLNCERKLNNLQSGSACSNMNNNGKNEETDCHKIVEEEEVEAALDDSFIYPQFSGMEFVQTAQLLDLCTLDLGIADFSYSVIAAAAMSHTFTRDISVRVSGLEWSEIAPCARWMEPFFDIASEESPHLYLLEQNEQVKSKFGLGHVCPNIVTDDSHIIQTHTTSVDMFERAIMRREYCLTAVAHTEPQSSPAIPPMCPEGLLTPPSSSRKPLDVESEPEVNI